MGEMGPPDAFIVLGDLGPDTSPLSISAPGLRSLNSVSSRHGALRACGVLVSWAEIAFLSCFPLSNVVVSLAVT